MPLLPVLPIDEIVLRAKCAVAQRVIDETSAFVGWRVVRHGWNERLTPIARLLPADERS